MKVHTWYHPTPDVFEDSPFDESIGVSQLSVESEDGSSNLLNPGETKGKHKRRNRAQTYKPEAFPHRHHKVLILELLRSLSIGDRENSPEYLSEGVDVIFLAETKVDGGIMTNICNRFGFPNVACIPARGLARDSVLLGEEEWTYVYPKLWTRSRKVGKNEDLCACLPLKTRLGFVRADDDQCVLRGEEAERDLHIFCTCPFAPGIWFLCSWGLTTDALANDNFEDFFLWLCNTDNDWLIQISTCVLEAIWRCIIDLIFHGKIPSTPATLRQIGLRAAEFQKILSSIGETITMQSHCLVSSVLEVELVTILKALERAWANQYHCILIESDSKVAIEALQLGELPLAWGSFAVFKKFFSPPLRLPSCYMDPPVVTDVTVPVVDETVEVVDVVGTEARVPSTGDDVVDEVRLQFLESMSFDLEADVELSADIVKKGVLTKAFGRRALSKARVKKSLKKRPWLVNGALLNLRDWHVDGVGLDVNMADARVWVEAHGLPTPYLTWENIDVIAKKVGVYIDFDRTSSITIARRDHKLPALCFNCGYLAHSYAKCKHPTEFTFPAIGKAAPLYGSWIKVGVPIRSCSNPVILTMKKPLPTSTFAVASPAPPPLRKGKKVISSSDNDTSLKASTGPTLKAIVGGSPCNNSMHSLPVNEQANQEFVSNPSVVIKLNSGNSSTLHEVPATKGMTKHPMTHINNRAKDVGVLFSFMPDVGPTRGQMVETPHVKTLLMRPIESSHAMVLLSPTPALALSGSKKRNAQEIVIPVVNSNDNPNCLPPEISTSKFLPPLRLPVFSLVLHLLPLVAPPRGKHRGRNLEVAQAKLHVVGLVTLSA
ncbi:hypothetical protein G4B88_030175 [Cannabis sativa]|uniref:Uncharacterized protein n=1 Tax=Cannabis sativa TaxID=3483 RepID=A0A7J6E6P7_CANSA|nr:hypothetical protein G4B88_030175 [Cannabis sativa]